MDEPAGIVTLAAGTSGGGWVSVGWVTLVLELDRLTTRPPAGAAWFSCRTKVFHPSHGTLRLVGMAVRV